MYLTHLSAKVNGGLASFTRCTPPGGSAVPPGSLLKET